MLIPLEPGFIVNSDTIASMKAMPAVNGSRERTEITFANGARKTINRPFEHLEWCAGPIVPAPPGYSVIQAFPPEKDGEATEFATYPVIAFRLTGEEPVPIIPFGRLNEAWALVWPDGRCDEQWNQLFPSVDEFKASYGARGERS